VAIDIRHLRPVDMAKLLNSTPLGTVITDRQLYRHRTQAGFRLGDGRHVDLFRYAAWLVEKRHSPQPLRDVDPYAAVKEKTRARAAAISLAGRDIGELPAVVNPERKARAEIDFRYFCEAYFPYTFHLAWSPDHLKVIGKIEEAVLHGGLFAMAMPRGSGKTSQVECACLWAVLFGHREFVCLIGSDEGHAMDMLESIKTELDGNELLLEDFPEVVYPIHCLEGIANRCSGQLYKGQRTHIGWTAREIVLPTIERSKASSAIIKVAGITGRIRGMKYKCADGRSVRPSLVVLDDPQTDEALDVDTPILTPSGFVPMGDLQVSDLVFDEHGNLSRVLATSPVMYARECYRVTFDDGASVIADGGHRWLTSTALQRTNARRRVLCSHSRTALLPERQAKLLSSLVTTMGISKTLTAEGGRNNHSIPLADPLQTNVTELPVPPYTLGVWLGDGDKNSGRVTTADEEILDYIQDEGFDVGKFYWQLYAPAGRLSRAWSCTVLGLRGLLRRAGLLGNKHVPHSYWTASPQQRLALLQGLMDTDGSVTKGVYGRKGTRCTFSNTSRRLINAVLYLCRSLGIKAKCHPIRQTKPGVAPGWIVTFVTNIAVFRILRKRIKLPVLTKPSTRRRYVVSIESVPTRPVRCITVSSASGLYLCGKELIPTHNSARSLSQCATRESVLVGAVLGLAGPGKKISGIMPCTVIRPGDMADRILDRDKHPEWNGERTKMVYAFPTNEKLWAKYAEIRAESMRADRGLAYATEFYRQNREEMDAGAVIAWPERFNHDELSAVQHAMNLKLQDEGAFFAEYQNEPLPEEIPDDDLLTADQIAEKTNRLKRGEVTIGCNHLTMFIDVQATLLFYVVAAWEDDFTGYVLDYGSYPDQKRSYFSLRDARHTLASAFPRSGLEGSIYAGLIALTNNYLGKEWRRDDGASMRIERCLIDANWGMSTDVVYQFCRQSPHSAVLLPSHGRFVGASSIPFSEYKRKQGDRVGHNWRIPNVQGKRAVRHVVFDANYWKSFIHARLAVAMGDRGCLSLFGDRPELHRLFAEHITAEYRVKTEGRGRTVDEWKPRPEAVDNHWLDCLVGSAVAASIQGSLLPGTDSKPMATRPKLRLSDLQRRR
jgi:hypothetical protein